MNIVIDSDIFIYFLKGQPEIVNKLSIYPIENVFTTRINVTELLYGAYNSLKIEQNISKISSFLENFHILEFDQKASIIFAQERESQAKTKWHPFRRYGLDDFQYYHCQ